MADETKASEEAELKRSRARADSAAAPAEAAAPAATSASEDEKTDDRKPRDELWQMKRQRALADANKPIEVAAEALWSADPDKDKARKAIEEAYRKAARKGSVREPEGELHARYAMVDKKFKDAAADMLRSRKEETESRLVTWIRAYLRTNPNPDTDDLPVRTILRERKQVEIRLMNRLGPRERERQAAADETVRWEKAFGRWSSPDKEIGAVIATYADRIDQLNADINTDNNRDQAIFSFWFEVAPSHLQLRADKVTDDNAPGVSLIEGALKGEFPELLNSFKAAEDRKDAEGRNDGSIYLIDPDKLPEKRRKVLKSWQEAAERQSEAEANYATRPDAAADLKPRHDKLRDDGWVKRAKEALAKPKA